MKPGYGGHGYVDIRPDVPERFRCGDCCCRGMTGLCFLHTVVDAPFVSPKQKACDGFSCSLEKYERLTEGMLF